jgi:hypothetical protein
MKFVSLRTKRTHRRGKLHKPAGATLKRFTKSMVVIASISLAVMLLAAFTGCASSMTPRQQAIAMGMATGFAYGNDYNQAHVYNYSAQSTAAPDPVWERGSYLNPIYVTPAPTFNPIHVQGATQAPLPQPLQFHPVDINKALYGN